MNKVVNALGFQAGWWACVSGAGHGFEIESILFCSLLVCGHLYLSASPWRELKLGLFAIGVGIAVDSALQQLGIIHFDGWALGPLSPFWLWALWGIFALTLNSSLAFLKQQSLLTSAILGLAFGPVTYYAGARLGAAALDITLAHWAALALAWMLTMPLLVAAARHITTTTQDNP